MISYETINLCRGRGVFSCNQATAMKSISVLMEIEVSNTGLCPHSSCVSYHPGHWLLTRPWLAGESISGILTIALDLCNKTNNTYIQADFREACCSPRESKPCIIKCVQIIYSFKNYFEVQIYKHNQIT
jgi:hypothetical protein